MPKTFNEWWDKQDSYFTESSTAKGLAKDAWESREPEIQKLREERDRNTHVMWEFTNFPAMDGPCEEGCELCKDVAQAMDDANCCEHIQEALVWWREHEDGCECKPCLKT